MQFSHLNKVNVRGYLKPVSAFKTLEEWKQIANSLLELQSLGMDTRAGELSCKNAIFLRKIFTSGMSKSQND